MQRTASNLGADGDAYVRLMSPIVDSWRPLIEHLLAPFRAPRPPLLLLRFGIAGILPATVLARRAFRETRARALLAGTSAHSILPLQRPASSAFGLVMCLLAHAVGWPIVRGGTRRLADALIGYLTA